MVDIEGILVDQELFLIDQDIFSLFRKMFPDHRSSFLIKAADPCPGLTVSNRYNKCIKTEQVIIRHACKTLIVS